MTVIATDGESMAGDSLTTAGNQVVARGPKVHKLSDGRIVGACGDTTECRALVHWLETGGDKPTFTGECEALVLHPDGAVEWISTELRPLRYIVPMAIGSGGDLALGAMLAGADPEEAVRLAIERQVDCGGDIVVHHRPRKLRRVA